MLVNCCEGGVNEMKRTDEQLNIYCLADDMLIPAAAIPDWELPPPWDPGSREPPLLTEVGACPCMVSPRR